MLKTLGSIPTKTTKIVHIIDVHIQRGERGGDGMSMSLIPNTANGGKQDNMILLNHIYL